MNIIYIVPVDSAIEEGTIHFVNMKLLIIFVGSAYVNASCTDELTLADSERDKIQLAVNMNTGGLVTRGCFPSLIHNSR